MTPLNVLDVEREKQTNTKTGTGSLVIYTYFIRHGLIADSDTAKPPILFFV